MMVLHDENIDSGSIRGRVGVDLGSIRGRVGVDQGSIWGQPGGNFTYLPDLWGPFYDILFVHFGIFPSTARHDSSDGCGRCWWHQLDYPQRFAAPRPDRLAFHGNDRRRM